MTPEALSWLPGNRLPERSLLLLHQEGERMGLELFLRPGVLEADIPGLFLA